MGRLPWQPGRTVGLLRLANSSPPPLPTRPEANSDRNPNSTRWPVRHAPGLRPVWWWPEPAPRRLWQQPRNFLNREPGTCSFGHAGARLGRGQPWPRRGPASWPLYRKQHKETQQGERRDGAQAPGHREPCGQDLTCQANTWRLFTNTALCVTLTP